MTFFRVYNYSTAFLLLSYSITPKPEKQISGYFETLTAMYWDVPPCELSCKAALQPEKQHSSLPKPWRDAAAGQHCVPSNVTWPEVCLRLCKKGFSWNTTLYSAVKWGSIQVFSLKSAVMFCKIWVATKKMETVFGDSPWKKRHHMEKMKDNGYEFILGKILIRYKRKKFHNQANQSVE